MKPILTSERGVALVIVIFIVSVLLALSTFGLFSSSLGLKATSSLKKGTITFHVADAGIQHALALIPLGVDFPYGAETIVVPETPYPSLAGYSYEIKALNTAGGTKAVLTSVARGPNGEKKTIKAYVGRSGYGYGAIHAPGSAANIETGFSGTSFSINGNDRCTTSPAPRPSVPGLSTTDPALTTEITNATLTDGGLDANQMANVTGAGGTPSVQALTESHPTVTELTAQLLALGEAATVPYTQLAGGNYGGNEQWGTADNPRITRITGSATISGTVEGYGVLIVDSSLTIAGNFTFNGLVIARGDIEIQVNGNAGIFGSLLLDESGSYDPNLELDIRGNGHIRYDSCALATAESWVSLPKAAKLLAWQEEFSG